MARAVISMSDTDVIDWVLVDNSIVTINKLELKEALRLSGIAMTGIWIAPYQN